MAKWRAQSTLRHAGVEDPSAKVAVAETADAVSGASPATSQALRHTLMALPARSDSVSLYGRGALWLALTLWGLWFALHGIDWIVIGGSFMHQVNLPFHEFGHVLFMPLGRFFSILGGSLFQVALPLGLAAVFVVRQRDNFAASVCLWWCGQSFVDLAPYIADAPYRMLPLIGGMGESAHDWGNLLGMLGLTEWALFLARFSFAWGCITMGLASVWGFKLLRKQVSGASASSA